MSITNSPVKIGIVGYGNLGRGVEKAIKQNPDTQLAAVFTRRDPSAIKAGAEVVSYDKIENYKDKIDVLILCGGSATDLPKQGPHLAQWFNTVDSYDNHAKIPGYFDSVDAVATRNGKVSLISVGWDPGLFSMLRAIGLSVLPIGETYTFWGKGVSQGHSDAIRRIPGVKNAIQYTVPIDSALEKVRAGGQPQLETAEKHERVCYVVAERNADKAQIEKAIKTMPNYFEPYRTTVHFITEEELKKNHSKMPHGGIVFRTGVTGEDTKQRMEFHLALESNPEFTSNILVAFARAIHRLASEGVRGAKTVFDIPIGYLSALKPAELRKNVL